MLRGSREAILQKIQPLSVHGQISLHVQYVFTDEPDGQPRVARIGPEAVDEGVEPGDRVLLDFVLGAVTAIRRTPREPLERA